MQVKYVLKYKKEDLTNISNSFSEIMSNDLRVAFVKCNSTDLKRILELRKDWGVDNDEKHLAGAMIMTSSEIKKGEVIIISE